MDRRHKFGPLFKLLLRLQSLKPLPFEVCNDIPFDDGLHAVA